ILGPGDGLKVIEAAELEGLEVVGGAGGRERPADGAAAGAVAGELDGDRAVVVEVGDIDGMEIEGAAAVLCQGRGAADGVVVERGGPGVEGVERAPGVEAVGLSG